MWTVEQAIRKNVCAFTPYNKSLLGICKAYKNLQGVFQNIVPADKKASVNHTTQFE